VGDELGCVADAQRLADIPEGAGLLVVEAVAEPEDGALPLREPRPPHRVVELARGAGPLDAVARCRDPGLREVREGGIIARLPDRIVQADHGRAGSPKLPKAEPRRVR
jgi:hypothetical protein